MMTRPLDNEARRNAIRRSPEVLALRHLARAYGVTFRRRRRVGPVVFDVGFRDELRAYGTVSFTDEGRIAGAALFRRVQETASVHVLAQVLEFGPLPDGASTTRVAHLVPVEEVVPTTIVILPSTPIVLPQAAAAPLPVVRRAGRPRVPTLAERRQAVIEALPDARRLWARFIIGLALTLQLLAVAVASLAALAFIPIAFIVSTAVAAVGVVIAGRAIAEHDRRRAQLHSVGLA